MSLTELKRLCIQNNTLPFVSTRSSLIKSKNNDSDEGIGMNDSLVARVKSRDRKSANNSSNCCPGSDQKKNNTRSTSSSKKSTPTTASKSKSPNTSSNATTPTQPQETSKSKRRPTKQSTTTSTPKNSNESEDEQVMKRNNKVKRFSKPLVINSSDSSSDSDNEAFASFNQMQVVPISRKSQNMQIQSYKGMPGQGAKFPMTDANTNTSPINSKQEVYIKGYMNRMDWNDMDYQRNCLKNLIELLVSDQNSHLVKFMVNKIVKLYQFLPPSESVHPIVRFDSQGEPNFEFYFQSPSSPLHITEVLKQVDIEMLQLSKVIYGYVYAGYEAVHLQPIEH